jgi:hypothetical protein
MLELDHAPASILPHISWQYSFNTHSFFTAVASLPKHLHRYYGQADENVDLPNDTEYFFGILSDNSIRYEIIHAEIVNVV